MLRHVAGGTKGSGRMVGTAVVFATMAVLFGGGQMALGAGKSSPSPPAKEAGAKKEPRAIIKTKFGDVEIKLFPEKAPKHVDNFIKLAKSGFYNGTIFHRVIPGFMIQGGDPNTKDSTKKELYGQGGPGHSVKAEFNDTPHKRGIVSMARAQDPDSAGSQFFIVVENSPFLDGKYTVFGEVVKGMGVADKIVNLPKDERDNPVERVEMTVTVVE